MTFSWPIFLTILLLGVLQLAVGMIVGRLLPWRLGAKPTPERPASLHDLAEQVRRTVAAVAGQVVDHGARLREASDVLTSAGETAVSSPILDTIAGLLTINEQLRQQLRNAESRLSQQAGQIETHFTAARTDALTRLPNRRAFDDELLAQLAHFHHEPAACSLVMLDIDYFKKLNDQRGHQVGDQALGGVAEVLRRTVGERGLAARVGGEEFAVLLPRVSAADAQLLAERIRVAVAREELPTQDGPLTVTVSVGVAGVQEGDEPATLVRRADEALYAAKRGGRNTSYYHNGVSCQRIAPADNDETGWRELCDDLRDRLDQLVK